MPEESADLLTASGLAKLLGLSDAKVKKAIAELGLVPAAKKGCCNYYSPQALKQIEASLKP
jgi:hypothetical protein